MSETLTIFLITVAVLVVSFIISARAEDELRDQVRRGENWRIR